MKLNKLKIQAFAPFAGEETICFSDLGDENSLFLIDGATGAGKSSILHAICYALYGETTDSERKDFGLRCDYAADKVLTEVTLEFCVRGKTYRITRQPTQQERIKANVHLRIVNFDGSEETVVSKKISEANTKIEEIIGLNKEQFRQVMVLPQGKFRELLLAKSTDRQAILSTLFQTEIFKKIEQLLKDKSTSIEREYNQFQNRIKEALSDADVTNLNELTTAISEAKTNVNEKTTQKEIASIAKQNANRELETAEALQKEFETRATKQQQCEKFEAQEAQIQAQKTQLDCAEKAETISHLKVALNKLQSDISEKEITKLNTIQIVENTKSQLETAEQSVKKAEQNYQQRDDLKRQENQLLDYQKKLVEYEPLKNNVRNANNHYEATVSERDTCQKELNILNVTLENQQLEIKNLKEIISCKTAVAWEESEAKAKFEKRNSLEKAQTDLTKLKTEFALESKAHERAKNDYEHATKSANLIEMHWFNNQAAVLAQKLEIGKPCAVCGSTTHPNPAIYDNDSAEITKTEVDEAREEEKNLLELKNEIDKKRAVAEQKVVQKNEEIQNLINELRDATNSSIAELKASLKTLKAQLKNISETEVLLNDINKKFDANQTLRDELLLKYKTFENQVTEALQQKMIATNTLKNADRDLPEIYRDSLVLEKTINEIQQKIKRIESQHSLAQKELKIATTALSSAETTFDNTEKLLIELKNRYVEQNSNWHTTLLSNSFESEQNFESAKLDKKIVDELKKTIEIHETTYRDLKTELRILNVQLAGKTLLDLTVLKAEQQNANNAYQKIEAEWTTANQKSSELDKIKQKIENLELQQSEIKNQYEMIGELAKAASGQGNRKVSLERFVLGSLLDSVLDIASKRLLVMSKGQYQLLRQNEENQKKNVTAGLDLAVHDANTGKTRPVQTLSGGESFMASLSLALALSDVVQQRSGGIQLDTLFIDEGFGSLDQESLQLAIQTLVDLQATGRTIGIISHVSELKEQMAQRIEVVSSRSGSKIKTPLGF